MHIRIMYAHYCSHNIHITHAYTCLPRSCAIDLTLPASAIPWLWYEEWEDAERVKLQHIQHIQEEKQVYDNAMKSCYFGPLCHILIYTNSNWLSLSYIGMFVVGRCTCICVVYTCTSDTSPDLKRT